MNNKLINNNNKMDSIEKCSCGSPVVSGHPNCNTCSYNYGEGKCCFCGNECNPHSQSCGICMRNFYWYGVWIKNHI